jgi:hypothetical protein
MTVILPQAKVGEKIPMKPPPAAEAKNGEAKNGTFENKPTTA